jgi:hypothetical protein
MERIFSSSLRAAAILATVWLASLSPVSPQAAKAQPPERLRDRGYTYGTTDGYYYGGGYGPPVGYSPYGYTSTYGYADPGPGGPVAPSYRAYGLGNGFGTGGTYRGVYRADYNYGVSHYYGLPSRLAYSPYGYGGYGPYGFRVQQAYGY